jgi:hypothetical protein
MSDPKNKETKTAVDTATEEAATAEKTEWTLEELTTNPDNPFDQSAWIGPLHSVGQPRIELIPLADIERLTTDDPGAREAWDKWVELSGSWWGRRLLNGDFDKNLLTDELVTEFDNFSPKEFGENRDRVMVYFHVAMQDRIAMQRALDEYEQALARMMVSQLLGGLLGDLGLDDEAAPPDARNEVNGLV